MGHTLRISLQDLRTARSEGFCLLTGLVTAGAGKGRLRAMFSASLGRRRPDKGEETHAWRPLLEEQT